MLELKKEQHEEFNKKVTSIAEGVGCKVRQSLTFEEKFNLDCFILILQSVEGLTLNHSTATFVFSATKS